MYYPITWPKVVDVLHLRNEKLIQLSFNRDRVLLAILTNRSIAVWQANPCYPLAIVQRCDKSINKFGENIQIEWKPDSSMLVVSTVDGCLLYYSLTHAGSDQSVYEQSDPSDRQFKRDSAELYSRKKIVALQLTLVNQIQVSDGAIKAIVCISFEEFMIATENCHMLRYKWDFTHNRDYDLDLHRIPFCIDHQAVFAKPIEESGIFVTDMCYSSLMAGFSITLNDGRAAFLTATTSKFDPNQTEGVWAQEISDATCTTINHKYGLILFGKKDSRCFCYTVDKSNGSLTLSHVYALSSKDYPLNAGAVKQIRWSPDFCALFKIWEHGGFSVWSTFGSLLTCSLTWDFGFRASSNQLMMSSMDFSVNGYQLWFLQTNTNQVLKYDFVKSALTFSPCMNQENHLYLQGSEKLYVNIAKNNHSSTISSSLSTKGSANQNDSTVSVPYLTINSTLAEGRQWLTVSAPSVYMDTNWPIKFSAIDFKSEYLAISGRKGFSFCGLKKLNWKLFGNEVQERNFCVTAGLFWWKQFIVLGCVNLTTLNDEIRFYSRNQKLDNQFATILPLVDKLSLINIVHNYLVTFCLNSVVNIFLIEEQNDIQLTKIKTIDLSKLCDFPICMISVTLMFPNSDHSTTDSKIENIIFNISGKLFMINCDTSETNEEDTNIPPTILATGVENVWLAKTRNADKHYLTEALWIFCGSHGMHVWLPLQRSPQNQIHAYMAKRIMLTFHLNLYPLMVCFEDAIILGVENDTNQYMTDSDSHFSLPFCVLKRTSQVYLHQILRQLIQKNLGNLAWEIAQSCSQLSYFPHSLELLFHEVLEEEATNRVPNPDACLARINEFISEFQPYYLQTIVQCARKTEVALWPHLFKVVGKPRELFEKCLANQQFEVAASYLIIIQNLEPVSLSLSYTTTLLETTLKYGKWMLAKDLVRFLKAIKSYEVETPRNAAGLASSNAKYSAISRQIRSENSDLDLVLMNDFSSEQRSHRSSSTTVPPKAIAEQQTQKNCNSHSATADRKQSLSSCWSDGEFDDNYFVDSILNNFAVHLVQSQNLSDLGYFAAYLDFHLVHFLSKEKNHAAKVTDFVVAFKKLHEDFTWSYPNHDVLDESETSDRNLKTTIEADQQSVIADSGYTSLSEKCGQSQQKCAKQPATYLERRFSVNDKLTVLSTSSSQWMEERDHSLFSYGELSSYSLVDNTVKNKPPRSEVQLFYLLQIMIESNCLDWALLIAILLQDKMAVTRIASATSSNDMVQRLKNGFLKLYLWSKKECLGYKSFLDKIENDINKLCSFEEQKILQNLEQLDRAQKLTSSLNEQKSRIGPVVAEPTSSKYNLIKNRLNEKSPQGSPNSTTLDADDKKCTIS